jgi:carboxymethylenebutenolidase
MASFLSDPSFLAAHEAPLEFRFQSSVGHEVTFTTPAGASVGGGYYVPQRVGVKVGLVMVHEWWGLNDYIKREAVRLHEATGYAVLAVDLYDGHVASTPDEAGKLMAAVDQHAASYTVTSAVRALKRGTFGPAVAKVGSIGWCFGGGWSLQTAIQGGPDVKACVMYYGYPDLTPGDLSKLHGPVLMMEALKDKWITPQVVAKFKTAMKSAGKSLTVRTYSADHAFANPSNPHYDRKDAVDAMAATLQFYRRTLG